MSQPNVKRNLKKPITWETANIPIVQVFLAFVGRLHGNRGRISVVNSADEVEEGDGKLCVFALFPRLGRGKY